ncbi:glycosyltransferase family 39 protein [Actinomycetes bacterium KLBMP 9797]
MSSTLTEPGPAAAVAPRRPAGAARLWRGRPDDPTWVRPALLGLLLATAVLYIWGLGASGWANSFYAAAVQAGSASWKAFFFGSSDAANAITVDKPPASLWVMALSVRIFGLSSWSMLVPQALLGVAAVGLLYATVRRWSGPVAGLLAGALLALTPVAVLMFRFNNPDALLVLLLVAGAYATVRAIETASTKWLVLVGVFVGFGFLTKMLQALLVVPAFALAYLIAAPTGLGRRIVQLLVAGIAMVVSAGWYVATVELIPAQYRPYIGGSENNSLLELTLGYNGLGRIFGRDGNGGGPGGGASGGSGFPGGGGPGGGGGGFSAGRGILRMFDAQNGGQIAWLLPAALILLVAVLVLTWRAPRTERTRAAAVLWGGWLLVTGLVFSFMEGTYHEYYTVALAPAVSALVAVGGAALWQRRDAVPVPPILAATTAMTAVWAWFLLGRSADWQPWLRWVVLVGGLAAAAALLAGRLHRRASGLAAVAAVAVAALGPFGYALSTAATPHRGSIPMAGPDVALAGGPGSGFPAGGRFPGGAQGGYGFPGFPGGAQGTPGGAQGGAPGAGQGAPGRRGGGPGGFDDAASVDAALVAALTRDADTYTWVAAAVSATNAAGYQLATEKPVMAIGGFSGGDPAPTLAQFQQYVADKKIHYFIGGGTGGGMRGPGGGSGSAITEWVTANFTATTVGGVTLYDLTTSS